MSFCSSVYECPQEGQGAIVASQLLLSSTTPGLLVGCRPHRTYYRHRRQPPTTATGPGPSRLISDLRVGCLPADV
jgi:hypothetical protein